MKTIFCICLFTCVSFSFCIFQFIVARQYQELQNVVADNIVKQPAHENYQICYEVIKPFLDKYKRPITVLDLGAKHGYFSFRIAHNYDCTCVMIEDNEGSYRRADEFLGLCHLKSSLQNIVLLNKKMTLQEIEKLADCEHFDVVLAFDYIDQENGNWIQIIDAILRLGNNIFIQAQSSNVSSKNLHSKKIIDYLVEQSGKLILQSHCISEQEIEEQLFWFERKKDGLRCKCFAWESKDNYKDLTW